MPIRVLADTCVWIDLARDHRSLPLLGAIEHLVDNHELELVVPQIVLDEMKRNRPRIVAESQRSMQAQFRIVREMVSRFGDADYKQQAIDALNEVDRKAALKGEGVSQALERIEKLLSRTQPLPTTKSIKQRATERALARKAPYHRDRNSVADAILIELYADMRARTKKDVAFVTHNTKDFSDPGGDHRTPHPDLAHFFSKQKSRYWISFGELVRAHHPELLDDLDAEWNFEQEPRRLSEILEAEHLLFRQVWYNRHWNYRLKVESGEIAIVTSDEWEREPKRQRDKIVDSVWALALKAAKRTEEEVGADELGPWDDFEWGMINGKLSALRWVLGDEWDMLDT